MKPGGVWLAATAVMGCTPAPAEGEPFATGDETAAPTTSSTLDTGDTADASSDADDTGLDPDGDADSTGSPPGDLPPQGGSECDALLDLVAALQSGPADGDAQIAAFFREVAYGERGFPIVEEERTCFAYRDAVGVPLAVTGDFNDWMVGTVDLDYAAPDFDLRYAVVEMPASQATGLYKLVRPSRGPEYFADPEARRFGWDEFGEYSRFDVDPTRSHYERWRGFDQGAGELLPRDLVVYVSAGGFRQEAMPVLYMHDGQNLFSPDALFGGWRVGTSVDYAVAQGELAPFLVVGIDNTKDRFDEYTHVQDDLGGALVGGLADAYADFIVDGIKPFIDARYPTSLDPKDTGVAGSSLGGLVSIYIGWRHADVFGAAGSMSGTVGWGAIAMNPTVGDLVQSDPPGGLKVYLDSGGGPVGGCPGGGTDNYCDNVELADRLRSEGWTDGDDLFYVWEDGASHNEAEWAERFPGMIRDWFPGVQ